MIKIESTLKDDYQAMIADVQKTIGTTVVNLNNELLAKTPVQTGNLRKSWQPINKISPFEYELANESNYADDIFKGRRMVGGRMIGSNQLPDGISPILIKYEDILENKLKEILK